MGTGTVRPESPVKLCAVSGQVSNRAVPRKWRFHQAWKKEFGYIVVSLNIGDLNIDPQYYNPHSKDPETAPLVLENLVLQQRKE